MKKPDIKLTSTRFSFIALGVLLGLLVMAQVRTIPDRITNPVTPVLSLNETKEILLAEQEKLYDEASRLQSESKSLQEQIKHSKQLHPEIESLERQKDLAGMTQMLGPGVEILLDDSDQSAVSEDAIIHAADLRDVINLLWNSGAEAISLNDQRIVFTTAIDCVINTIMVNNVKITNPFTIRAVGNSSRLLNSLKSPVNLADIKSRSKDESLTFNWRAKSSLEIPAYQGSFILSTNSHAD